jgi:hypothetical protein
MPIIDFTEIPIANTGKGDQDIFELFARDYFDALGFGIEQGPSRGPDGGKDLIVTESLFGTVSSSVKRWIVSCKHFIHSKKSVGDKDETDILGRVRKYKAQGFMAFYSTIPSSGLMRTMESHKDEIEIQVWDRERIESDLLTKPRLHIVFERYFPKSFQSWKNQDRKPMPIFDKYTPLQCVICGKDLLIERSGNVAFAIMRVDDKEHILDVYWACKGECDRIKERQIFQELDQVYGWESLSDLSIPIVYVQWFIATMNNLRDGRNVYTDEAFEKFKEFTICMSQVVVRETTPEQRERIKELSQSPSFIGGLGY